MSNRSLLFGLNCMLGLSIQMQTQAFGDEKPDSPKPALIAKFPGAEGRDFFVMCVSFSPNGKTIAMGSGDNKRGVIDLWDVTAKDRILRISGHGGYIYSVAFSPNGNVLASSSFDGTVRLWQLSSGKELHVLKGHLRFVTCAVFSPDSKLVVSGDDQNIYYWDAVTGKKTATVRAHQGGTDALVLSPDGKTLVSAGMDWKVKFWDLRTTRLKGEPLEYPRSLQSVAFSPNGKQLAIVPRMFRSVSLYDVQSGQTRNLHCGEPIWGSVSYSSDGKTLAVAGQNNVLLYDVTSRERICRFKAHEYSIYQVAFSPDGKFLATASSDNSVKLWNVEFLKRQIADFSPD